MPELGIGFTEAALNYLATIPQKLRTQIIRKAMALKLEPRPNGARPLKGVVDADGEPIYRERSGDYRILYVIRDSSAEVLILDIDHRKDVYR